MRGPGKRRVLHRRIDGASVRCALRQARLRVGVPLAAHLGGRVMPADDVWPDSVDVSTPNVARMYDYALGGKDNFEADREAVHALIRLNPVYLHSARENRAFLNRVVRAAVAAGVRQFLDIGSGLPTMDNVHQIAQRLAPGARVVYCDYDPIVVAHTRALLADRDGAWIIRQDLRQPRQILADPVVRAALDFREPVAILLISVLHFIPDEDEPARVVRELISALAPGSYLAISHGTQEWHPDKRLEMRRAQRLFDTASAPWKPRASREVARWLRGMEILPPGVVPVGAWRPDNPADAAGAERTGVFGIVAVQPPT